TPHNWGIYETGETSNLMIVRNIFKHCAGGIATANTTSPIKHYTVMDNIIDTPTALATDANDMPVPGILAGFAIQITGDLQKSVITGNTIVAGILNVFSATDLTITDNVLDLQQVALPNSGIYGAIGLGTGGMVNQVTVKHNRVTNGQGAHNPDST